MRYLVNWTLHVDGQAYREGDTVDLTDAQVEALNGSQVVTPIAQREAAPAAPAATRPKESKTTGKGT